MVGCLVNIHMNGILVQVLGATVCSGMFHHNVMRGEAISCVLHAVFNATMISRSKSPLGGGVCRVIYMFYCLHVKLSSKKLLIREWNDRNVGAMGTAHLLIYQLYIYTWSYMVG